MKEWEYTVEEFSYKVNVNGLFIENTDEVLETNLNEKGSEGWNLVNTIPIYEDGKSEILKIKLIYKRQK